MGSKWIAKSKIIFGAVVIILNSLVSLPFIPEEWRGIVSAVVAALVALDRSLGAKPALTVLPPTP